MKAPSPKINSRVVYAALPAVGRFLREAKVAQAGQRHRSLEQRVGIAATAVKH